MVLMTKTIVNCFSEIVKNNISNINDESEIADILHQIFDDLNNEEIAEEIFKKVMQQLSSDL